MKDFLQLLVENYSLPSFIASDIMLMIYIISFIFLLFKYSYKLYKWIITVRLKRILSQDLHPYFTFNEIVRYTNNYVPQYYQNIAPSEGEEPSHKYLAAARSKLMPEFIKGGLLHNNPKKYFIILADTGMGKTAFMINLFCKYNKIILQHKYKFKIVLFPLGARYVLDKIRNIEDKENTILLLDAFDEDILAINNYSQRMLEILEVVRDFRKIVFTCRTQFFPNSKEEPYETGDITFGDNFSHKIHKVYLSTFDTKDIYKFLIKRFGINLFKIIRAYKLVKKSPSLMCRPMLLSHINELIQHDKTYHYSYEIYDQLILNWVNRESKKPIIVDRKVSPEEYAKLLIELSRILAKNLYQNRTDRGGYVITRDQLAQIKYHGINFNILTLEDQTGRSLLNRNSSGEYKFAHKSILEYFLAVLILENPLFGNTFDYMGMDATLKFYEEMLTKIISKEKGIIVFKQNPSKEKNLGTLTPENFRNLSTVKFINCSKVEIRKLSGLKSLEVLIFSDACFLSLYVMYIFIILKPIADEAENIIKHTFYENIETYREAFGQVSSLRKDLDSRYIHSLISSIEIDPKIKDRLLNLLSQLDNNKSLQIKTIRQLTELREDVSFGKSERPLISEGIQMLNNVKYIKVVMPNTLIIY